MDRSLASAVWFPPVANRRVTVRISALRRPIRLNGHSRREPASNGDANLAAMVFVPRNRRVNRFSRLPIHACAAGTFAIFPQAREAHVYIPFIANLKLSFKFDRP
jgi:hypothetical protein